jgi:hypothetical protein
MNEHERKMTPAIDTDSLNNQGMHFLILMCEIFLSFCPSFRSLGFCPYFLSPERLPRPQRTVVTRLVSNLRLVCTHKCHSFTEEVMVCA